MFSDDPSEEQLRMDVIDMDVDRCLSSTLPPPSSLSRVRGSLLLPLARVLQAEGLHLQEQSFPLEGRQEEGAGPPPTIRLSVVLRFLGHSPAVLMTR